MSQQNTENKAETTVVRPRQGGWLRPWQKGQSGNPGGVGGPGSTYHEARKLCARRAITPTSRRSVSIPACWLLTSVRRWRRCCARRWGCSDWGDAAFAADPAGRVFVALKAEGARTPWGRLGASSCIRSRSGS